ncbi:S-layer protein domain-containing protein [Methanococcoides vulcani]|uniref:S-layer protein domain-containing protein n=1 Tax=Methanococcoides vulcani TaxID=1353158 RepID=UPI001082D3EE|nr:S-layer protein domain-containing protein [Methanococcoides vulcani]
MKSFLAIAMAALMVLSFVSVASAADSVEIRSPVFSGADDSALNTYTTDFTDFAAFWYDIDEGLGSEAFVITYDGDADRTLDEGSLEYTADVINVAYTYGGWADNGEEFQKLGFLAEEYVPVNGDLQILSTLIMDDDEKYTMRVGQTLDLGEGFALTPKQIDVDGNKVWLELTKDGEFLDDDVYNTENNVDESSWDYEADVAGEEDVIVMRVHINEVFQGQVDSLAIIEGIWLMSDEAMEIADDEEFGKMEVTGADANTITLATTEDITLSEDDTIELTETIGIQVADDDAELRFYFFEEITEPGTVEIRGTVAAPAGAGDQTWTPAEFAGFFYDIDDDIVYEELFIAWNADNRTVVEDGGIVYTATMDQVDYAFAGWADSPADNQFTKMGFLAKEYVPVNDDPQILSTLILDDDEKYTMRVGQTLDLGEGFALTPKQIDVDGNKVWLELTKDGEFLDDDVYNTENNIDNSSWDYEADVAGEEDVVVMRVHINEVFQGQVDSLAIVEGIWLMSDEAMEIADDEEFGILTVEAVGADFITLENTDEQVNLNADDVIELTDDMKLRVADSDDDDVRFYPFVEMTVDGEAPEVEEVPEEEVVAPEEDVNVTPEEDVNVTPEEDVNVTPEEEPVEEEEEPVPGFEAVFAIAGLLAVAYFVRRN